MHTCCLNCSVFVYIAPLTEAQSLEAHALSGKGKLGKGATPKHSSSFSKQLQVDLDQQVASFGADESKNNLKPVDRSHEGKQLIVG